LNEDQRQTTAPPESTSSGGSPTRTYVVLEQRHEEDSEYYVEVRRMVARNATTALRRAFAEMSPDAAVPAEAVLVAVSEGMWRPTPVRARPRDAFEISLGD
jgi:hypothetical protein